jgi:hypothetical protein
MQEPYPDDVSITTITCGQIEDLIKLLVTIRHRWGNTAIKYNIQWGASALWSDVHLRIEREIGRTEMLRTKGQVDHSELVKLLKSCGHVSPATGYEYCGMFWYTDGTEIARDSNEST